MVGNLDSDSSQESFSLYSELSKSHKWLDKVIDIVLTTHIAANPDPN